MITMKLQEDREVGRKALTVMMVLHEDENQGLEVTLHVPSSPLNIYRYLVTMRKKQRSAAHLVKWTAVWSGSLSQSLQLFLLSSA